MNAKEAIKSQYQAALEMLCQAILECPERLWSNPDYQNPFWHTVFHTLFYTHLYLQQAEEDFGPWAGHKPELTSLGKPPEDRAASAYSKRELLDYLELCLQQVDEQVEALDLGAESGFYWLPFNKLELQFYNIRHIQQHTGELCERLGATGDIEIGWVGMKPARGE
jgi:hypothetical protein